MPETKTKKKRARRAAADTAPVPTPDAAPVEAPAPTPAPEPIPAADAHLARYRDELASAERDASDAAAAEHRAKVERPKLEQRAKDAQRDWEHRLAANNTAIQQAKVKGKRAAALIANLSQKIKNREAELARGEG